MKKPVVFPPSAKAAIFDMDGTMIKNMEFHKQAWQKYLELHDIHLSEDKFQQNISGKKNDQIFELVFGRKLTVKELEKYSEEKEAIYRDLYANLITEVAGLTNFVHSLQAKSIKLADVINNADGLFDDDPSFGKTYVTEKYDLLPSLKGGNSTLYKEAVKTIINGLEKLTY